MREQSIRPLIAALEACGRLAQVSRAVDPARDMAAVALKADRERGKSVLFGDARGMRAAAQLLGDRARWGLALGLPAAELLSAVQQRLRKTVAPEWETASPLVGGALALDRLPMALASAGDAAPHMAAVAIALDPATGKEVIGLTRHHAVAPDRLSVMDLPPALAALYRRAERMPMALVLGGDPALVLAAAIGTWRKAELGLAGSLGGAAMRCMRDPLAGLPIPVAAELVILGEILPETVQVGGLVTRFGTQGEAAPCPVFAARAVLARPDAIFHAMQAGPFGDMNGALCLAAEALVAEHIRNIEGGIDFIDIVCPPAASAQVVVVKLRARQEGQAKTALMGALSGPVNTLKLAIAVDEDVDPADARDVFWSVASRTHAQTDIGRIDGMRAHRQDFAARRAGSGDGRIGARWLMNSTMPPLTQGKRRDDFARAVPKNLAATDLAPFLPK